MNLPVGISFNEELRLMVFRPLGIFDAKKVAEVVNFLEHVEDRHNQPFNRFTDTSKMNTVELDEPFIYRIALHRRRFYEARPPVKSAFYVTNSAASPYIRIHAVVTEHSPLKVKIFRKLDYAVEWLGVPRGVLEEVTWSMRTIEVRPFRGGWQVYEAPGVEPFYVGPKAKEHAIGYATERLKVSGGEVRVVDAAGALERVITGIVSG
jgi:hypothetical protein